MNLADLLHSRYTKNKLAHFYIIKAQQASSEEEIHSFANDFLIKVLTESTNRDQLAALETLKLGHSDILFIEKEKSKAKYTESDDIIGQFFKYINYKPLELNSKFIFFFQSEFIGEMLSNKLLKILEEPMDNTTIFFIHSSNKALLPTIESRAITMSLTKKSVVPTSIESDVHNLFKSFKDPYLSDSENSDLLDRLSKYFVSNSIDTLEVNDFLKKSPIFQRSFLNFANQAILASGSFTNCDNTLRLIKNFEKSLTFHNPSTERVIPLIEQLKVVFTK